jgi:outer membrane protein assembly factor BamB
MKVRLLAVALFLAPLAVRGDDWPQWMGPKRDNVWRETGLLDAFPASGPKILWKASVAGGYSGPAVVGDKVFVTDLVTSEDVKVDNFGRKPNSGTERVLAFNVANGTQLWKYEYPVKYAISYPSGPRCTPTVHDGKVYVLGAEGHLACLDAATGKKIWAKELKDTYQTNSALWGYAAHPLIDGKKLITLAGGEGSHVVALDKDTGAELWKSQTQNEQGYVPPSIIEAGGVRQLLVPGPAAVRALNPETGERLWTVPYTADSGSIIMTPIRSAEYLFVGGYKTKNLLLKLDSDKPGATEVWRNKRGMGLSPVNVQPILVDNVMYGFDESGELHAVELPSGKRLWTTTKPIVDEKTLGSGTAFIVKQADRFWLFNELGELVIAKMTPASYEEISRAKVIEQTNNAFGRKVVWSMPAFAQKKAFIRNDKELICVDLAK